MASDDEVYESKDQMIPENPDDELYEHERDRSQPPAGQAVGDFPERWSGGPDDSAERSEEFGEKWAGDNQPPRD